MSSGISRTCIKWAVVWSMVLICSTSIAQDNTGILGKIKVKDWPVGICPIDSFADAYYIFDKGVTTITPIEGQWTIVHERHFRIKIDSREGLKERAVTIWLKDKGQEGKEKLVDLKGYTYTLDQKKIVTTGFNPKIADSKSASSLLKELWNDKKQPKDEYTQDHSTSGWIKIAFKLPSVKIGSIIEVYYKTHSDLLFDFNEWQFQRSIPVLDGWYMTKIPHYFHYTPLLTAPGKIHQILNVIFNESYQYRDTLTQYSVRGLPKLPDPTYVNHIQNYVPAVQNEFSGFQYGDQSKLYTTTWPLLARDLLKDTSFGGQIRSCHCFDGFIKDSILTLNENDKIDQAYNYIKRNIVWNGISGIKAEIPVDTAFFYGSGTAAEINLALICLLKKLHVLVQPVLLSTVDHGAVVVAYPSLKWFNYVVAEVQLIDRKILLDAAMPLSAINMFPTPLLNGLGKIIDTTMVIQRANDSIPTGWTYLAPTGSYQSQIVYQLSLQLPKGLSGTYTGHYAQYAAYDKRMAMPDEATEKKYIEDLNYQHPDISIFETKVRGKNPEAKELELQGQIILINQLQSHQDQTFSLVPMQFERLRVNPISNHDYPVEFSYPIQQNVLIEIKLPDHVKVISLPKSARIQNEDQSAKYVYIVELKGQSIHINSSLTIKSPYYSSQERKGLSVFFNHVVAKQNEEIRLKQ